MLTFVLCLLVVQMAILIHAVFAVANAIRDHKNRGPQ